MPAFAGMTHCPATEEGLNRKGLKPDWAVGEGSALPRYADRPEQKGTETRERGALPYENNS